MTEQQEAFADAIIEAHKQNKGALNWGPFLKQYREYLQAKEKITPNQFSILYRVTSAHLVELKLIQFRKGPRIEEESSAIPLISELTAAGHTYGSFKLKREERERKENEDKARQKMADEKLLYDLKNIKRIYRTYWITFFFAAVGFVYVVVQIIKALTSK